MSERGEGPAFEIRPRAGTVFTEGRTPIRIWANGKVEGVEGDFFVVNRIPALLRDDWAEATP